MRIGTLESEGTATVSRQMVRDIWTNPYKQGETMYASLDVAGGGDNCVMIIWKELTIVAIENFEGDRSIDEMIATAMAFAGEETDLADFLKNAEPMFVTANGNLIKEQADFVKKWEAENPKPTTPPSTPPVTTTGGLSAEDVAAIVAKSLEPFASKLGEIDTQRNNRKASSHRRPHIFLTCQQTR